MYTLIFDGSPHKNGDTVALLEAFCGQLGGKTERIRAYEMQGKISACVDCRACWKQSGCAIKDGMQEIYEKIEMADVIVIASPVYYSGLTGPLLSMMSRLQCAYANGRFLGERMFEKQKLGAVLLAGGGNGSAEPALAAAKMMLISMKAKFMGSAMALNTDEVPAKDDAAAIHAAEMLAKQMTLAVEDEK